MASLDFVSTRLVCEGKQTLVEILYLHLVDDTPFPILVDDGAFIGTLKFQNSFLSASQFNIQSFVQIQGGAYANIEVRSSTVAGTSTASTFIYMSTDSGGMIFIAVE